MPYTEVWKDLPDDDGVQVEYLPPNLSIARGWAVVDPDGKINVRTVTDTRISALRNWLYYMSFTYVIDPKFSDNDVETLWAQFNRGHEVKEVQITT